MLWARGVHAPYKQEGKAELCKLANINLRETKQDVIRLPSYINAKIDGHAIS